MSIDAEIFTMCDHYTGGKQYIPEKCPKCFGKGYYYDISYDLQGHAKVVTGTIKLQQEMLKIINDVKGNNIFFERWGSELHGLIGSKKSLLTNSKLQMMIITSFDYLQMLQRQQDVTYKNMSQDEILLGVQNIEIADYTVGFDVSVTIENESNDILSQTILL